MVIEQVRVIDLPVGFAYHAARSRAGTGKKSAETAREARRLSLGRLFPPPCATARRAVRGSRREVYHLYFLDYPYFKIQRH